LSKRLLDNFFTFQGNLSKKDFWKNFFEKLLILIFFNFLLTFFVSFDGSTSSYGPVTASQAREIRFLNDNLVFLSGILNLSSFIIFSIYLLAICRRRVRDMGSDSLVTIIFSIPLTILSGIYLGISIKTSTKFFVYFIEGSFRYLKDVLNEFLFLVLFSFLILFLVKKLKN